MRIDTTVDNVKALRVEHPRAPVAPLEEGVRVKALGLLGELVRRVLVNCMPIQIQYLIN